MSLTNLLGLLFLLLLSSFIKLHFCLLESIRPVLSLSEVLRELVAALFWAVLLVFGLVNRFYLFEDVLYLFLQLFTCYPSER